MMNGEDNGEVDRVRVSVIIPTLNEADNLRFVLSAIPDIVEEVLIVDGGSTDGTVDEARRLRPDVRIIEELRPGKGRALRTGFEEATGDILVMIDADGSMDPREIPAMVAVLESGADVVKGSRFLQGAGTDDMGWLRRSGNAGLRLLVRALFGGRYSDLCYGYMAFWRDVLPAFEGDAPGFEVETFLNVRALAAGLRIAGEGGGGAGFRVVGGRIRDRLDGGVGVTRVQQVGIGHGGDHQALAGAVNRQPDADRRERHSDAGLGVPAGVEFRMLAQGRRQGEDARPRRGQDEPSHLAAP